MWDDLFRHWIKNMKGHCDAGMKLSEGLSAEATFDRKKKLLLTVNEFCGSKEFESQKRKFTRHVEEFETHYNLKSEEKPCGADRRQ